MSTKGGAHKKGDRFGDWTLESEIDSGGNADRRSEQPKLDID